MVDLKQVLDIDENILVQRFSQESQDHLLLEADSEQSLIAADAKMAVT